MIAFYKNADREKKTVTLMPQLTQESIMVSQALDDERHAPGDGRNQEAFESQGYRPVNRPPLPLAA